MILHTIIICTANRTEDFRRTMLDLRAGLSRPDVTEILVVNNGPASDTQVLEEYARAALGDSRAVRRIIHEPAPGLSHARNRALAEARGELITMIDDDASPAAPDWQEAILTVFAEHPEVGLCGGPSILKVPEGCKENPWWRSDRTDRTMSCLTGREPGPCDPECIYGVNATYRKAAISDLKYNAKLGWNHRTKWPLAGEDTVFHEKICENGWVAWFEPRVAVLHRIQRSRYSAKWLLRRAYIGGRTSFILDKTFRGRPVSHDGKMLLKLLSSAVKLLVRACQGKGPHAFTHLSRIAESLGYFSMAVRYVLSPRLRGELADARESERQWAGAHGA